jgi:hypothetical protein
VTVGVPSTVEKDLARYALAIQQLAAGRSNAYGTFTMTQNAASTTVTDRNVSENSAIQPIPLTANAGTEYGSGNWYISAVANGSFTITHTNSATASRTTK